MEKLASNRANNEISTEERILLVAAEVFTRKGYEATKTRDIAEAADINISSLHYYFRSKDKLFERVIGEKIRSFSGLMDKLLNSEQPLHRKIREFVPAYIQFLQKHPQLPMFILSESQRNADKLSKMLADDQALNRLRLQLHELETSGTIRPMGVGNFFSNLIGMVVFPFLAKPMIQIKAELDESGFHEMLEERKTMIADMMINYLYYQVPED